MTCIKKCFEHREGLFRSIPNSWREWIPKSQSGYSNFMAPSQVPVWRSWSGDSEQVCSQGCTCRVRHRLISSAEKELITAGWNFTKRQDLGVVLKVHTCKPDKPAKLVYEPAYIHVVLSWLRPCLQAKINVIVSWMLLMAQLHL